MKKYQFTGLEPVEKGWSGDKKYCATGTDGKKYLLRTSELQQYDAKKHEFEMMGRVAALGISMCMPLEFGVNESGVYSVQSWIDGEDAERVIPILSDTQQYIYGLEAGEALKKIHSIPAPAGQPEWECRFNRKMDYKIQKYLECPIHFDGADAFISYINSNRHLLKDRPQCYQHGDFHIGNMMIDRAGRLQIVDFNRNDYGDPWEEFNRIVWCAQASPLFATGMVNGYFGGKVPMEFWRLLALYISSNSISSVYWAIPFGQDEVDVMLNQVKEVLQWYDGMKNPIPSWYQKDFYYQIIDGIPYKLKRPFNFDFLHQYGKVFQIFDDQDSGNICFGTEKEGKRYFVKFAGAPTAEYSGDPQDAILRLKETLRIYQTLHHPNLVEFVGAQEISGGFAMVFNWVDGECMGRMYPVSRKKFMAMPMEAKLNVFRDILRFMEYIASQGYLAVDFYDGSILYDFEKEKTTVCDIDLFRKLPTQNDMGRMWGSSRFQAPEEFEFGAPLDEVTNVYTLGAVAFALFSDCNREEGKWPLGQGMYMVASKAVSADRRCRQQSIRQFIEEWETAEYQKKPMKQ